MDPLRDALTDILAVGGQHDITRTFQGFQRHNSGQQLHPVIGGKKKALTECFLMAFITQQRAVAAGARISEAGAVGENFYLVTHLW